MKKTVIISIGFILLIILVFACYCVIIREKPEYLILEIPNPQYSQITPYSSEFAHSEEFSTFVWHDSGHRYFIWRMYSSINLGEEGFHTISDVEKYYDEKLKNLGWEEAAKRFCDPQMSEFQPEALYRAYQYPTKYYVQPIACLAVWPEFEDGNRLFVLIKTVNPSSKVLSEWD